MVHLTKTANNHKSLQNGLVYDFFGRYDTVGPKWLMTGSINSLW